MLYIPNKNMLRRLRVNRYRRKRGEDRKSEPDVAANERIAKSKEMEIKEREYLPVYRRDENSSE